MATEPFIAADPKVRGHLIGVWQQYTFDGGLGVLTAVSFDGGHRWRLTSAPLSRCEGGAYGYTGDPWVTIGPDGTALQISLAFFDKTSNQVAVVASRSMDGGLTWQKPVALAESASSDTLLDKPSITADPQDPLLVYAAWTRYTGLDIPGNPNATGPAWFSRSTDGGVTWEPPRLIFDPGAGATVEGCEIGVLRDGTLVNLFGLSGGTFGRDVAIIRSGDNGLTWSAPVVIGERNGSGTEDIKVRPYRILRGFAIPHLALDVTSGALYAAWEAAGFNPPHLGSDILLSKSVDGGTTWSVPARVNPVPVQSFLPSITVASNGVIGVAYYDTRDDDPSDDTRLLARHWFATSSDGANWQETALGDSFDLLLALFSNTEYFLGDYQGLTHDGNAFIPFFAMTDFARSPPHLSGGLGTEVSIIPSFQAGFFSNPIPTWTGISLAPFFEASKPRFDATDIFVRPE